MSNAKREQSEYWNGPGGARWVTHQDWLDRMVRPFGSAALERLELQPGEHVLDVGCGCGDTLLELQAAVGEQGSVTGIDLSGPMVARARERAPRATVIAGDVTEQAWDRTFDAIYSRLGVMFFAEPVAAFQGLRALLAPSRGRLGFVCWRDKTENSWGSLPMQVVLAALPHVELGIMDTAGGPGPFALADRGLVDRVLREAGFGAVDIVPFDAEVELGTTGAADAARMSLTAGPAARLLAGASAEERGRAEIALTNALADHVIDGRVALHGAAWLVLARP